jgi:hypothetical protein
LEGLLDAERDVRSAHDSHDFWIDGLGVPDDFLGCVEGHRDGRRPNDLRAEALKQSRETVSVVGMSDEVENHYLDSRLLERSGQKGDAQRWGR